MPSNTVQQQACEVGELCRCGGARQVGTLEPSAEESSASARIVAEESRPQPGKPTDYPRIASGACGRVCALVVKGLLAVEYEARWVWCAEEPTVDTQGASRCWLRL